MLSAPFIREAVGASLTNSGWSWADDQGNLDIRAPGLVLRQRRTSELPRSTFKQLPQGNGGLAIIRALIRETMRGEGTKTAYLANESHVSQPRVSQVLRQLEDLDLLDRSNNRDWEIDRTSLIDLFDSEYKGPGGSEQFYYVLDSPTEMAIRISRIRDINTFVVSADVGPDLIAPWRRPSSIIVYGSPEFSTVGLDMVAAQGQHDANVIVRLPQDTSVFPSSPFVVELSGTQIPLADPTQMLWDMKQLGGDDRLEAADHLREWLLRSR
jgi:hypothetical protein